jgi:nitroreductase
LTKGEIVVTETDATLPLLDVIARRFSSRAFASTPLSHAVIETLLEAARWAPSYGNRQPSRFVVVRDPEVLRAVHEALTRGNAYAKVAPVLIAVCGNPEDGQIVTGREYYLMDAGLALENLLLQAVTLGLHAHPMGGFDEQVVRDALGVPAQLRVLALVAVGYPGNVADLDERTRERELRPRSRKDLDEIRAYDRWVPSFETDDASSA